MKKKSWIFWIIIMVACISLGVAMPELFFAHALDKSKEVVESSDMEPVKIKSSYSVIDAMKSYENPSSMYNYQEDMASLSRERVLEISNEFMKGLLFQELGITEVEAKESNTRLVCCLYVVNANKSEEIEAYSTVMWTVIIEVAEGQNIVLTVDDKNAKVVRLEVEYSFEEKIFSDGGTASSQYVMDVFDYCENTLTPFLKSYYGLEAELIEIGDNSCTMKLSKGNEVAYLNFNFDGSMSVSSEAPYMYD